MAVGRLRRAFHWLHFVFAVVLTIVVWGLVVLVSSEPKFKALWDLSPQEIGTVSPLTEQLIAEVRAQDKVAEFHLIQELVTRAVTPEQEQLLRIRQSIQQQTWDLLQRYAALGGGNVRVRRYSPTSDEEGLRELTQKYPVTGYGQVVIVLGDRHEIVSMAHDLGDIDPGERLQGMAPGTKPLPQLRAFLGEQVLSSRLKELLVTGRPRVYFLKGLQLGDPLQDPSGQGYAALANLLEQDGIEVMELTLRSGDGVPSDASAVALMEPTSMMPTYVAEALEAYVRRGGRLLLNPIWHQIPDKNPDLAALADRLGFALGPRLVCRLLPDRYNLQNVRVGLDRNAVHELVGEGMLSRNHPVTRSFVLSGRGVQVGFPRELRRATDVPDGVRPDPSLMQTSADSWLEDRIGERPDFRPRQGSPEGTFAPRTLGMIIDVDGQGGETGNVLVLSGQMFNQFILDQNRDFALSVFNWLTRREVLVAVRARKYRANRMDVSPQQLDRIHTLCVVGFPSGLLALCLIVLWRRSR